MNILIWKRHSGEVELCNIKWQIITWQFQYMVCSGSDSTAIYNLATNYIHIQLVVNSTQNMIFGYPESTEKWVKGQLNMAFLHFCHIWWFFKIMQHLWRCAPLLKNIQIWQKLKKGFGQPTFNPFLHGTSGTPVHAPQPLFLSYFSLYLWTIFENKISFKAFVDLLFKIVPSF